MRQDWRLHIGERTEPHDDKEMRMSSKSVEAESAVKQISHRYGSCHPVNLKSHQVTLLLSFIETTLPVGHPLESGLA
jgi:hypothetical protein